MIRQQFFDSLERINPMKLFKFLSLAAIFTFALSSTASAGDLTVKYRSEVHSIRPVHYTISLYFGARAPSYQVSVAGQTGGKRDTIHFETINLADAERIVDLMKKETSFTCLANQSQDRGYFCYQIVFQK
jgi:hypothetical protein